MAAYETDEWALVESRRTLMQALDLCDGDLAETVREIIEQVELVALAIALGLPDAIEGHAARIRADKVSTNGAQAAPGGRLRRWIRKLASAVPHECYLTP